MKILNIVGARPNFMKIAPLMREYKKYLQIKPFLIHTDQHYDYEMSEIFFKSLGIKSPDYSLGVKSGSHGKQTAKIIIYLEKIFIKEIPDLVLVVGDINSTLAGALTAVKMNIPVAHVEAGLRSFDMSMPEEINRLLTDHIADFLFVTEKSGVLNLKREGISSKKIHFVGNTMIDNLIHNIGKINASKIISQLKLLKKRFITVTLHRPSNVDNKKQLKIVFEIFRDIPRELKIVFSVHPRTRKNIGKFNLEKEFKKIQNLEIIEPLDYPDFMKLVKESYCVMTDSGGIQEETAYLKVPTLTMRETTERPATIECGSNYLTGLNKNLILKKIKDFRKFDRKKIKSAPLWDGKTSQRIVKIIYENL